MHIYTSSYYLSSLRKPSWGGKVKCVPLSIHVLIQAGSTKASLTRPKKKISSNKAQRLVNPTHVYPDSSAVKPAEVQS